MGIKKGDYVQIQVTGKVEAIYPMNDLIGVEVLDSGEELGRQVLFVSPRHVVSERELERELGKQRGEIT